MAVHRMDQQSQRHPDAGVRGQSRRSRRSGAGRQRVTLGSGRTRLSRHPGRPLEEAAYQRNERRLAALGIARTRAAEIPVEPVDVGQAGEEAVVEGVRGTWRVDPRSWISRSRDGPRCCRLSTGCFMIANGSRNSSSSSTCWRCTSTTASAAEVTSRCPSCTRTGSWESWTRPRTVRSVRSASTPSSGTSSPAKR